MKPALLLIVSFLLAVSPQVKAQSSTTESFLRKHSDAFTLFFYKNTLRMLNQTEDKELDDLIKDIKKMRFLLIEKAQARFGSDDYRKLVADYKAEQFEEIMTSRYDGKNFDIFLKEEDGTTKGMLVLINDQDNLYIVDILGRITLDKVTSLYDKLNKSTEIGHRIRQFTHVGERQK